MLFSERVNRKERNMHTVAMIALIALALAAFGTMAYTNIKDIIG